MKLGRDLRCRPPGPPCCTGSPAFRRSYARAGRFPARLFSTPSAIVVSPNAFPRLLIPLDVAHHSGMISPRCEARLQQIKLSDQLAGGLVGEPAGAGNTVDFGPFGTKPGQTQPPLDLIDLARQ
jgi:hypothetical protein